MLPTRRLTLRETRFIEAFLVGPSAGNAAKSARIAGYGRPQKVIACKLLKREKIKAALVSRRAELANQTATAGEVLRERSIMSGDEALARMTMFALADIRKLLPHDDPLQRLDDQTAATVKSVRPTKHGRIIELHDSMRATEILAKAGGKLRDIVQVQSLEEVIAASWQRSTTTEARG